MSLPASAYLQLTPDLRICRLLNGMWQVSGAHGAIDRYAALRDMRAYHEAGFTTWDLADHYGPAEDFIGAFRAMLGSAEPLQAFTKWVPRPARMTRAVVEQAVDLSRQRMGVQTLDLLQFHWWDYRDAGYLDALKHLTDLRDAGKIRHLALTNFDTERLRRITDAGIRVVSNQVQYSLVDRRPEAQMVAYCQQHNITLLTYGTYLGGFLSDAYLNAPEPRALSTASQRKYKQMLDLWGGWAQFQQLLQTCARIALKHGVSIAAVGARAVLERPAVAGVIAGARLGVSQHREDNARLFNFALDAGDHAALNAISGRDLLRVIGDCGDEYRR